MESERKERLGEREGESEYVSRCLTGDPPEGTGGRANEPADAVGEREREERVVLWARERGRRGWCCGRSCAARNAVKCRILQKVSPNVI